MKPRAQAAAAIKVLAPLLRATEDARTLAWLALQNVERGTVTRDEALDAVDKVSEAWARVRAEADALLPTVPVPVARGVARSQQEGRDEEQEELL